MTIHRDVAAASSRSCTAIAYRLLRGTTCLSGAFGIFAVRIIFVASSVHAPFIVFLLHATSFSHQWARPHTVIARTHFALQGIVTAALRHIGIPQFGLPARSRSTATVPYQDMHASQPLHMTGLCNIRFHTF